MRKEVDEGIYEENGRFAGLMAIEAGVKMSQLTEVLFDVE